MAEPSTTTAAVAAAAGGITVGSALLGMDTEAATGALVGAAIFVASADELKVILRIIYLFLSVALGYILTPEIITHTSIQTPAVAGFIGGLFGVTVGQFLLKKAKTGDISLPNWIIRGPKK